MSFHSASFLNVAFQPLNINGGIEQFFLQVIEPADNIYICARGVDAVLDQADGSAVGQLFADPLIEYAIDYSETQEDFCSYRVARRCAMKRAKESYWGTARIYEITKNADGEEVEAPSFQEFGKGWKKPDRIDTN